MRYATANSVVSRAPGRVASTAKGKVLIGILPTIVPTGTSRMFDPDEIIFSKTDLQGRLTYVNDVFLRVSGYSPMSRPPCREIR